MARNEALVDNIAYFRRTTNVQPQFSYPDEHDPSDDPRLIRLMADVPRPVKPYAFSYQQRKQQRQFFLEFLSLSTIQLSFRCIDLYRYKIIAIRTCSSVALCDMQHNYEKLSFLVPERTQRFIRYLVESLFTIHGETKLNMIHPWETSRRLRSDSIFDSDWCIKVRE